MGVLTDLLRDDIERLTDERDGLRAALEQALPVLERAIPECRCYSLSPECPKCIARLALAETQEGGTDA